MPLYEYECQCNMEFTARQSIEKRRHALCPSCGRIAEKKLSVVNNTFGWELTDESHLVGHKDEFKRAV
jgi:putative FmdB family regulatory protein